ncbi:hypothetical protein AB685_24730 [Bacillus sp. LL01]|uniref:MFS transporter n=1 Tax=Bacillus sp. LL01 TaxID=1665556 RepID=UPI00064CF121|nr:MFS transporter [Bacillus sp. LL01]KMJ55919.1 hypothetical protein AB685_24730 [Bacillus sp. LL01]
MIADRISKAWVMFLSDFLKGVLLLGMIGLLFYGAYTIWPFLAATMLAVGGYVLIFTITAVSLIMAGVIDLLIKKKMPEKREADHSKDVQRKETMIQAIKGGLAYVRQSPFLLALMTSTIFLNFFFSGPLQLGMPLFSSRILNGDEVTYALLNGGIAAGMLVGGVGVGLLNIQRKRGL